jgi:hypothetical protein
VHPRRMHSAQRESSGRHLATRHVARRFGVTPAAVRAMVARGELEPAHVIPPMEPGDFPVYVFHADYIEERSRAREQRREIRRQTDIALGFAPAPQGALSWGGEE